jgi:cell division protein YceG involved in septum cleavage
VNTNNFNIENFIKILLDNFKQKVYTPLLSPITPAEINELIIIASIVEKEERNVHEKSTVAGILIKRYKENWMIGADITACYAHDLTSEECRKNLSKYIADKNDYNTRTMV